MNRKEQAGCDTAAQRFCTDNYPWLVSTSERELNKRGFPDRGRDLAHDVRDKCGSIDDSYWETVKAKHGYVARIIINEVNDFCRKNASVAQLSVEVMPSTSAKAMDDAILLTEVLNALSPAERIIIELHFFEGYSELETAEKLGLTYGAIRKRIERIMRKLNAIMAGIQEVPRPSHSASQRLADRI
jgi:RNA polymerase sigma factor (sigma-70 family)